MEHECINGSIPQGMRVGRRELNEASLKITVPTCVPERLQPRMREISELYVPPSSRNHKLATALMNFVCQEADANMFVLLLKAWSFTKDDEEPLGLDDDQLIAWYKRFGFTELIMDPSGAQLMARQPRRPHAIERAVKLALVN